MNPIAATSLSSAGITPTQLATEPESVRSGGAVAQRAYDTGLGFQSMLMNELTQQLTSTLSEQSDDSDGLGGTDPTSSGGEGSPLGGYGSLMSSTLAQGASAGGNDALAMQIARSIDPRLGLGGQ